DLAALLGTPDVAAGPLGIDPAYRVAIDVQRFESSPGDAAVVEALWVVRRTGGAPRSGLTLARESAQGGGYDALAAAHSRAIARLAGDIAAAIRAEAGPPG